MTTELNGPMDLMELDRVGMGMAFGDIVLTDIEPELG